MPNEPTDLPKVGTLWRARDPTLLSWGGPKEPVAEECSICDAPFNDQDIPLIMWREDGWCVRLCDACVERWIEAKP